MIYDYLDKWLTECEDMEILLSYETHWECGVGFSDHLICWRTDLAAMSNTQASFSPVTPMCHFTVRADHRSGRRGHEPYGA